MDTIIQEASPVAQALLEKVLCDLAQSYAMPHRHRSVPVFAPHIGQYLILDEGWENHRRIHHVWAHAEVCQNKFYIQEDDSEEGIANLLLEQGVPHDHIVLAFHEPAMRPYTDFATE